MYNVAVITPVYNTQDYLRRCIESVLKENSISLQHIIINDGSTDNSERIAKYYAENDKRVELISTPNQGQGLARNIGIERANAEYIYFVDSDDYLGQSTLSKLYHTAKKEKLDICSPGVPSHYFEKPLDFISCLPCKSQFIRSEIIKSGALRQPDISSGQDGVFSHFVLSFCNRIGMTSEASFHYTHAREGSTFASHLKRHDLIPDIISKQFKALRQHYQDNNLWKIESLRLLHFLNDETLRNRIMPHYPHFSNEEKTRVIGLFSEFVREVFAFVPADKKSLIPQTISKIAQMAPKKSSEKDFAALLELDPKVKFPKSDNFKRGNLTICKRIYDAPAEMTSAKPTPRTSLVTNSPAKEVRETNSNRGDVNKLNQKLSDLEKKLDFLVNCLNNSTVQIKNAIQNNQSDLSGGVKNLVASVTTLPSRLNLIHYAIESIFAQTIKPEKIILWITDDTDRNLVQTEELQNLQSRGLEIRFVKDVGPHTKLFYALRSYPDASIMTFDDDIVYPINMIQTLFMQHLRFPKAVIGNWVRELAFDNGKVMGIRKGQLLTPPNLYKDLEQAKRFEPKPSLAGFPYGTSGVLYPPKALHSRVFEIDTFKKLCPKEDDIWFRAMGILNNTPVVPTNLGINPVHHCLTGSQVEALRHDNHGEAQNIEQMRKVFDELDLYKFF